MSLIEEHLSLLGKRVKDRVTGVEGIVTSVSFDLYGCIQATINPGLDKDGKARDIFFYDVARIKVMDKRPVMRVPDFTSGPVAEARHGAAEKPSYAKP